MIIYIPDNVKVDGYQIGCFCKPSVCECLERGKPVFVDVGIKGAVNGMVDIYTYKKLIRKAIVTSKVDVYAVVPDRFCDVDITIKQYVKYAKMIRVLGARPVLVLQKLQLDKYADIINDADLVALPSRRHCDVECIKYPRVCASRINAVLSKLSSAHLLGPPRNVLRLVDLGKVRSIDTSAYRRIMGRYINRRENVVEWFMKWIDL